MRHKKYAKAETEKNVNAMAVRNNIVICHLPATTTP